ncbi:MAG: type II toxin-antitoxin system RelE/ParE family toxin [Cyclobacteriaceae bacterium]|nr:type II toxin-antitoxin system RelE/ParE family toxin [Cyclobacteriaceae bacterium]
MIVARVIWTEEAFVDLECIHEFIAQHSANDALQIIQNILSRTRQLEEFPQSGAIEQTLVKRNQEYRYLVEGNYKIIYSYHTQIQTVYIKVIFDTRSDPEKLLKVT